MERGEGRPNNGEKMEIYISSPKVREQMEVERRRGEAELRGEIRREVDKLREEVAEVQVITPFSFRIILGANVYHHWHSLS